VFLKSFEVSAKNFGKGGEGGDSHVCMSLECNKER
jgi:hypothetical protein